MRVSVSVLAAMSRLLRLGPRLAWPRAGHAREPGTARAVHEAAHDAEDRALHDQRSHQLLPARLAVFRRRRLLLGYEPPGLLERLASDDPGDQPGNDRERHEHDLQSLLHGRYLLAITMPTSSPPTNAP